MTEKLTDDAEAFGEGAWVYCKSHMRPHTTGWCGVAPEEKIALEATDYESAKEECRAAGYELFEDVQKEQGPRS